MQPNRLFPAQIFYCRFQHFILAGANALYSRLNRYFGLKAKLLQLPAIGVADIVPAKSQSDISGNQKICNVAVCPGSRATDKLGAVGRFKKQTRVFSLALSAFIDKHQGFAFVHRQTQIWGNMLHK